MNNRQTLLPGRTEPESHFAVVPTPPVPFRGTEDDDFERLKNRLLQQHLNAAEKAELYAPLRRAANDAAAVAWVSGFPLLFLPALLEEKAQTARRQVAHQDRVFRRCQAVRRLAA